MRSCEQKTIRDGVIGSALALALAAAVVQPAFGRDDHDTRAHAQTTLAKNRPVPRPPSAAVADVAKGKAADPRTPSVPGGDQGRAALQPNVAVPPPIAAAVRTQSPAGPPPPAIAPPGVRPVATDGPVQPQDASPPSDHGSATTATSAPPLVPVGLLALAIGTCAWTLLRRRRRVGDRTVETAGRPDAPGSEAEPVVTAEVARQTTADPEVVEAAIPRHATAPAIERQGVEAAAPILRPGSSDDGIPGAGPTLLDDLQGGPTSTPASADAGPFRATPHPEAREGHEAEPGPAHSAPATEEAHPAPTVVPDVAAQDPGHAPVDADRGRGETAPSGDGDMVDAGSVPTNATEPPAGDAEVPGSTIVEAGRREPTSAALAKVPGAPAARSAAAVPAPTPRAVPAAASSSSTTASLAQEASDILKRIVGNFGKDPEKRASTEPAAPRGIAVGGGQATWFPAGAHVAVANASIVGGMVYVGSKLPSSSNPSEPDNCLVDPRLTVAKRADVVQPLPYWPSYARITPGWRRAYLDFLAGPRSDPNTPIGLVFLYFYGLERRALLDQASSELDAIIAEVRRLGTVYGANHSFRHYADELLAAVDLLREDDGWTPSFEPAATVPMRFRVALGRRAAEGRPIDPELLLAVTMSHPETRVRTPARRALPILRKVFATKLAEAHPSGLLVKRVKTMKALTLPYRAASGSFTVDVHPAGEKVPDVLARDEPLATGRRLLDACTDELDAFSRELGKLSGASPTLAALAKLPTSARREAADALPDPPLAALDRMCAGGPVELPALQRLLGLTGVAKATRARTSEAATVLAKFGFGLVPDPTCTVRTGKAGTSVVVFALGEAHDHVPPCSDAYRSAHLALALGVMVAVADGQVDARERDALLAIARQFPGLSPDEARRLAADLAWFEANPAMLGDLKAHLGALPAASKRQLLDVAIGVSMADDVVTAREVSILEKIGRQLALDPAVVYSRLHAVRRASIPQADDDLPEVIAPGAREPASAPPPIAGGAAPDPGLDLGRLAAIRTETLGISSLLGEIFADEEEVAAPVAVEPIPPTTGGGDGLDAKHSALLVALSTRDEWTSADFERLVREAGLMPGAAREALNDWSLERHDELVLEGEDPVVVNVHLVLEGV